MIGAIGHIGLGKETAWGTPVAATKYVPFVSEGIAHEIEQLVAENIRGIVDESASHAGLHRVAGQIEAEVHPNILGHLLRSALGPPVSTQIGVTPAYQHVYTPTQQQFSSVCALPPYTLEIYRGVGQAFQAAGAVVNSLEFRVGMDQKILRVVAALVAKSMATLEKTTPSFETTNPFTWAGCTLKIGAAVVDRFESVNVAIRNELEGVGTLNTTDKISRIVRNAKRNVELTMRVLFEDHADYTAFKDQVEQAFEVGFEGAVIEDPNKYALKFEFPKLRFTAFPVGIAGPGRIAVDVTGRAKYDPVMAAAVKVTLINTETSY